MNNYLHMDAYSSFIHIWNELLQYGKKIIQLVHFSEVCFQAKGRGHPKSWRYGTAICVEGGKAGR